MHQLNDLILTRLAGSLDAIASLRDQLSDLGRLIGVIQTRLDAGGVIYTCGNGGSAAEALHLAEELIGRYCDNRPPKRSICLNADPTAITCIANDFGFDEVFARQITGLGREHDALVVFSTSGRSRNVVRALAAARDVGVTTIGLLGKDGGDALALCDEALVVWSSDTAHIQEAHQVVLHLILEAIEAGAAKSG